MKRFIPVLIVACLAGVPALFAQESASAEGGDLEIWKWANFLLLAGGLGYLIGKNAGPFFAARSQKIRQEMSEAEELSRSAEVRAAEVDRKLASLAAEIAAFRQESQVEAQNETKRMRLQTASEIARIKEHAEQEIVAAGKGARLELKRYAASLAIGLAEQKARGRMTSATQDALVRGFVRELDRSSTSADSSR